MSSYNIDKNLLIHSIKVVSNNDDGDGANTVDVLIENVRFEKGTKLISDAKGDQITSSGMFFYDIKYSTPYNFKLNDIIKFNNIEYVIAIIEDLYTFDLNHKEIHVK